MKSAQKAVELQRAYYTETAGTYNSMHMEGNDPEQNLALSLMHGLSLFCQVESILDVGSGTGRVILSLQDKLPDVRIVGIEPVAALREIGYKNGISQTALVDGDATSLAYADGSFDLVCAYAVLHHIPNPRLAIADMLRVAKKAVFISDSNRFGQGSYVGRLVKLFCCKMKLWPIVNYIKTKGKGYTDLTSIGDGIAFSYSIFDDYDYIARHCKSVLVFNLDGGGKRAITDASKVGLLAIK